MKGNVAKPEDHLKIELITFLKMTTILYVAIWQVIIIMLVI
jgi:hypothetical protein